MSDKRQTRVAIMTKGLLVACIAVDTNCPTNDENTKANIVGSLDPRCNPAKHYQNFLSPSESLSNFNEVLAVSRDRGWTVAHVGARKFRIMTQPTLIESPKSVEKLTNADGGKKRVEVLWLNPAASARMKLAK